LRAALSVEQKALRVILRHKAPEAMQGIAKWKARKKI
jgi:hypothetical protein